MSDTNEALLDWLRSGRLLQPNLPLNNSNSLPDAEPFGGRWRQLLVATLLELDSYNTTGLSLAGALALSDSQLRKWAAAAQADATATAFPELEPKMFSPEYQVAATLLHTLIFLFGMLGNLLVIAVVMRRKFLQTPVNYYLVSLAIADVLVLLASIPDSVASYFRPANVWVLGQIGCQTLIFLQYLGINASSASMLAFSVERYYAVCRPRPLLDYQVSQAKIRRVILALWIGTSVYCSPWFWLTETASMGYTQAAHRQLQRCQFRLSRQQYAYLFIGDLALFYALPLLICGALYAKMGLVLYRSTQMNMPDSRRPSAATSGIEQQPVLALVPESPAVSTEVCQLTSRRCSIDSGRTRRIVRSRIQVVKMLALVVFLFAVLSVPYRCLMVYNCFADKPWLNVWYLLFAKTCIFLNSAINPVLYNVMNCRFRMAFRSMLACEKTKK
ncbi:thyrotropin-releasing hormone receptor-like [Paramacrobiotus metropolitanus]|uniref:thyrotropin-releasing hormone receptor-like n=1 Tax=Paramacrobiotus metropolitanus TaxID=2943436 RepID=UPI00244568DA|nr:thyrotropin-releasing hormone receptor-like [Paramacrobiotus metropolitanus]